ncbi:protein of unknown function [Xenorhabdus poinarii G6]|uniref:Uncharacterized protein n=1 Tax=Xenorhabdus poinarii G6 TaxID=1354304 RepID=A0A068QYT2_9GAMM|nr:protein of unknown function [Xenorhabdus poinarii G6]
MVMITICNCNTGYLYGIMLEQFDINQINDDFVENKSRAGVLNVWQISLLISSAKN